MSLQEKVDPQQAPTRAGGPRGLVLAALLLATLLAVAFFLRIRFHGEALADFVEEQINSRIRGSVEIGTIEWTWSGLPAAAAGGWLPVEVRDVVVKDALGEVVIRTPQARAEIRLFPLIGGPHFYFRDIELPAGGYARIREVRDGEGGGPYAPYVVSLISAFRPEGGIALRAGASPSEGPTFDLQNYRVENIDLDFEFRVFRASAKGVSGSGMLKADGRDSLAPNLYFALAPTAKTANLEVGPVALALEDLQIDTLAQLAEQWPKTAQPTSMRWKASAKLVGGGAVTTEGAMLDHWSHAGDGDYDINVVATLPRHLSRDLTANLATRPATRATLRIHGPRENPEMELSAKGLQLDIPTPAEPVRATIESARAALHFATDSGVLQESRIRVRDGVVRLAGDIGLSPASIAIEGDIEEPINLARLFPPAVVKNIGSARTRGSFRAFVAQDYQELERLQLRIGTLGVRGRLHRREPGGVVQVDHVNLSRGTSTVELHGAVDPRKRSYDIRFGGNVDELGQWLTKLELPPLARAVDGTATLKGSFDAPRATASLSLRGIPLLSRAVSKLRYQGKTLTVDRLSSGGLGGSSDASGALTLGTRPSLEAQASGEDLSLAQIPQLRDLVTGKTSFNLEASGPLSNLVVNLKLALRDWALAGTKYDDSKLTYQRGSDGSHAIDTELVRSLGGRVLIAARAESSGDLSGKVGIEELPLSVGLKMLASEKIADAKLSGAVELAGSTSAPAARGDLDVKSAWFRDAFLGSGNIQIEPLGDHSIRFSGRFFQDMVYLEGTIGTAPPFEVALSADVHRVEIDRAWPGLERESGIRGWISGKLSWRGALMGEGAKARKIDMELSEAVVVIDSDDQRGRPSPIKLQTVGAFELAVEGDRFKLLKPVVVTGPAGQFSLAGKGSLDNLDVEVDGAIAVGLLEPYFRDKFEELDGDVKLRARLTGPIKGPRVTGIVEVQDLAIKPLEQDTVVNVPAGKIEFANDQLSITGLSMLVTDKFSSEQSELFISGGVKLENFEPRFWAIQIDGQLAGKMLLVVAPELFSDAAGVADLSIALLGPGAIPDIDGSLEFLPDNPLSLVPRGLRREITLTNGALAFNEKIVELDEVQGWFDDEGRFTDISGELDLENWRPTGIHLEVSARDVPFRVPQKLELVLNTYKLVVEGNLDEQITISGRVDIVDGRYFERWKRTIDFFRPARSVETGPSFLETVPLIANANLDLVVRGRSLTIRNNIAKVDLGGTLDVTGTPARPKLNGLVRVEQGSFTIQGIRPTFTRTSGSLWFDKNREFPEQSPLLDIRSESDFRSTTGEDHLIILEVRGPIFNLQWDLKTLAGLNRNQTLSLIAFGRTFEETRAGLGDEPVARVGEFSGVRTTDEVDGGAVALADELAKSLSSDLLSSLFADPIKNLTNIDVVRIGVGATGTAFVHLEDDLTRSIRVIGDYERSSRGSTTSGQGKYRITDFLSADYEYLRKRFDDDAELDLDRHRFKFTYRLPIIP